MGMKSKKGASTPVESTTSRAELAKEIWPKSRGNKSMWAQEAMGGKFQWEENDPGIKHNRREEERSLGLMTKGC